MQDGQVDCEDPDCATSVNCHNWGGEEGFSSMGHEKGKHCYDGERFVS